MFPTDDSEHAEGLGGPGITFVLSLIIKHRLVDDEGPLDSIGNDFILLSFPDLDSVLEPENLQDDIRFSERNDGRSIIAIRSVFI